MTTKIVRKRQLQACQLREGMMLDFEDGEPGMVSGLIHAAHKVLFAARGDQFSLDRNEIVFVCTIMKVIED